ncbi:proteasome subunit alpha type-3-like isoform X5 [Nerophis ophidion]|uniref:proteasome subunit alpha type-3-like isoform X5 n=1 Tax=Nerophis ophidion TaxID=159077 RepID=UPI002ADF17A1|nr:proteasome subunit alpha type-3-like isoform X5 [Nerophis ophidion]
MVDPSGVSYGDWGFANGKAKQAAKREIAAQPSGSAVKTVWCLVWRSWYCPNCTRRAPTSTSSTSTDTSAWQWRGLLADARSLAEVAREEASNYGHDIPLKASRRRVVTPTPDAASCQSMWPCTCTPTPRTAPCDPFGCSFILRSHNKDDDLQLYMADPSGVSYGY